MQDQIEKFCKKRGLPEDSFPCVIKAFLRDALDKPESPAALMFNAVTIQDPTALAVLLAAPIDIDPFCEYLDGIVDRVKRSRRRKDLELLARSVLPMGAQLPALHPSV